jgi:hypothetical protein
MSNAVGVEKRWKMALCAPEKTEPVGGGMEFEFKPLGRSAFGRLPPAPFTIQFWAGIF